MAASTSTRSVPAGSTMKSSGASASSMTRRTSLGQTLDVQSMDLVVLLALMVNVEALRQPVRSRALPLEVVADDRALRDAGFTADLVEPLLELFCQANRERVSHAARTSYDDGPRARGRRGTQSMPSRCPLDGGHRVLRQGRALEPIGANAQRGWPLRVAGDRREPRVGVLLVKHAALRHNLDEVVPSLVGRTPAGALVEWHPTTEATVLVARNRRRRACGRRQHPISPSLEASRVP